jgi:drug/metabolite transporter (DMT)-like permease
MTMRSGGSHLGGHSDNVGGALWIFASACCFVVSVSLVKYLGRDVPPAMQVFIRQVIALIVLLPWILRNPVGTFRTRRPGLLFSRSMATSTSMVLAYYSYQRLPLAEANALSFSRVLWMVPLAIFVLGERVPTARLVATLGGFAGVLIVLSPGGGEQLPLWPAAAGLFAAFLLAFSLTGVKSLTRDHGQLSLLAWAAVLGTLFTLPMALLTGWVTPGPRDALLLMVMGAASTATQFCYIRGLTLGDSSVVAPVDYSRIVLSAAFGAIFFGEIPSAATWTGVAVIVGTTLFITWHASRRAARQRTEPA